MEESKPPRRMKGVTVCLPIVYGSIAWHVTKKGDSQDQCTHQWTLYVRSPHGHDLSTVLKKTVFTLHPSFLNHIREVATHPFEVTEKGWGEFEALVDLHFKDAHEKSVELRHFVKLFHGNSASAQPNNKKPVVHEYYDEVVFTDPTEEFYQCLQHLGESKTHRHTLQDLFPLYNDVEDVRRIQAAHEFITDQLRTAKDKLLRVESSAKAILDERRALVVPPTPVAPTLQSVVSTTAAAPAPAPATAPATAPTSTNPSAPAPTPPVTSTAPPSAAPALTTAIPTTTNNGNAPSGSHAPTAAALPSTTANTTAEAPVQAMPAVSTAPTSTAPEPPASN